MENIVFRNVTELAEPSRRSLEELLGATLHDDQRIVIMVIEPAAPADDHQRATAAAGLREIIAAAQAHADRIGVSDSEIEAAVEDAMAHVRQRHAT